MTRLMRFCRWIGHSGTSAVIAEQFGTAMMPLCSRIRPALISGITSGTFGSMRKAEELSITTASLDGRWREFSRGAATCREQRDVDALERLFGELLDHDPLTAEVDGLARRPGAGQRLELADGKGAPVHGGDEFGADSAGYTSNGNNGFVAHGSILFG